jgi:hypothetical protein
MPSNKATLEAAMDNFEDNLTKVDSIVNGDSSTTVTVDSGTVSSVAKLQSDMQGSLTATNFVFVGDGATVSFLCTGSNIATVNGVIVTVDGVLQPPSAYTISGVDTVVMGAAPAGSTDVQIRVLGVGAAGTIINADSVTYIAAGTGAASRDQDAVNAERLSVTDFGAVGDGVTDDTTAVQNALVAGAGKQVFFPTGTYLVTSDLLIPTDYTELVGQGRSSIISLTASKIHLDAVTKTTHIYGVNFRDLKIQRTGTAGPAIHMEGQNTMGVARWHMHGVEITSTGTGIQMEAAWIWDMVSCVIAGCTSHGVDIRVAVDGNSSANAGRFIGCEIQGNAGWGVFTDKHNGLAFVASSIEGNTLGGVNLQNNGRVTSFVACYFELNGTPGSARDILAGDTTYGGVKVTGYALGIFNCGFLDGSGAAKDYAVELSRMAQVTVTGCYFDSYVIAPVYNNPEVTASVTGHYETCGTDSAAVLAGGDSNFSPAFREQLLTVATVHAYGTMSNDTQATHDFTVTGAVVGDWVTVSSGSNLQGLIMTAQVVSADTVRVTLTNVTGGSVPMASSTFRICVSPYNYLI